MESRLCRIDLVISSSVGIAMEREQAIRNILDKVAENRNYSKDGIKFEEISLTGGNYTSALYRAVLQDQQKDDIKLFVKLSIVGNENNMDQMFDNERFFYTELLEVYKSLYEKYEVPEEKRCAFPEFYAYDGTTCSETIVLEDLEAKGYKVADRLKSATWEFAEKSIEELTKYHALSFALKERNPSEYDRLIGSRVNKVKLESGPQADQMFASLCGRTVSNIADKNKGRFVKFLETLSSETFSDLKRPMEGSPGVMVHGDFRQSNLMFKRKNGKIVLIPLDYQTIHSGRATTDLIYFIMTSTDQQFRRLHYQRLIDLYYAKLTEALQPFEVDVAKAFPKDLYLEELRDSLVYAIFITIIILPFVTRDPEDTISIEAFFLTESETAGKLYVERLNEIVEDLVTEGLL